MIGGVLHIGLTVSDLERSVAFYRDVLGLTYQGDMKMKGEATDRLFRMKNCEAHIAYLNGDETLISPSIELIQFVSHEVQPVVSDLQKTSISEVCFEVKDMEATYQRLLDLGVEFLSPPQLFDFSEDGFGKSKAVYFKDPDGIILELIEPIQE
ncbi:MAG: VOC family protein [Alcaligenaceae bacterium]|nr:VOC family protein [Alcaligenaceae bacterium]